MSSEPPRSSRVRALLRRRGVRALLATAVVAGLVLLAPSARRAAREWSRDELARKARATLAEALGARVEIESARMPTLHELQLHGLRFTEIAGHPEISSLLVQDAVAVPGGGETVAGSWSVIDSLVLHGAVLTLRRPPTAEGATAEPPESRPLRIGRLELRDGLIVAEGEVDVGAIRVEGELQDWGGNPKGEARFRAHRVPLRALVQSASPEAPEALLELFGGCCGELRAVARLDDAGRLTADGTLVVPRDVPGPGEPERVVTLTGSGAPPDATGLRRIALAAVSEGLLTLSAEAVHDPSGFRFTRASLDVPRLPRAWLGAAVPAEASWTDARVKADATRLPDGRWQLDARASSDRGSWRRETPVDLDRPEITALGALGSPFPAFEGSVALGLAGRPSATLTGRASREGGVTRLDLAWEIPRQALVSHEAQARALGVPLPEAWRIPSHGALTGRLAGEIPGALSGDARVQAVVAERGTIRVTARDARARLSRAADGSWLVQDGRLKGTLSRGRSGDVAITASGRASGGDGRIAWSGVADLVPSTALGRVHVTGGSESSGGSAIHAELSGGSAVAWLGLLSPDLASSSGLKEGAAKGGELAGTADARWTADGRLTASGSGRATQVAVQSGDFTRAVTIPVLAWSGEATGMLGGDVVAHVGVEAEGAQLLWGSAFADLTAFPPKLDARVELPHAGGWSADVSAGAGRVLDVTAELGPAGAESGIAGRVTLQVKDVAAAWTDVAASGLLAAWPRAADLAPGGSVALEGEGSWRDGALALDARATVTGGSLSDSKAKLALENLRMDLPMRLRRSPDEDLQLVAAGRAGRLGADRVAVLGAEARGLDVALRADDAALVAEDDVKLSLLGGSVVLTRISLADPLRPTRALQAGVELQGLQLHELGPVGPFTLTGLVSARFPSVSASATSLEVEGGARVLAWGGEIVVDEIAGENPWSRFPRTRIAAHFSEIDLHELTTTFGFGAVQGLAAGEVAQLELLGLAPVRFDARIETEAREGVRQSISIPALQNLATLATGGRAPLFDKGLLRLVRTVRYEKIGMAATLQADAFVLRGLAERHGRELFMKGRLPLRVDVANAQPGAAVSFRAMMSRLSGLEETPSEPDADAPPETESGAPDQPETEIEIQ